MKRTIITATVLLLMLATAIPALAKGSEAQVRVTHASPGVPAVDILVNDEIRAFEGVEFGETTRYASLPAGVYNFKVVPAGAGPESAVIDENVNLFYNSDYTVVAVNPLASIDALVLEDKNIPTSPNKTRLRFLHASPDAQAVDVAAVNGPILFSDIEYTEVGDYIKVPAGTYDLEVRLAGTDTVVLPLNGIGVPGGATLTFYAVGFATGGSPELTAVASVDVQPRRYWWWFGNDDEDTDDDGDNDDNRYDDSDVEAIESSIGLKFNDDLRDRLRRFSSR